MFQRMGDARLDELRFLARLERERAVTFSHRKPFDDSEVRIAIQLLAAGIVNDATVVPSHDESEFQINPAEDYIPYRNRIAFGQWQAIGLLHRGQEVRILATHAAAVRRAELEQSMQRGRLRDPMGILFDGRYANRDLQIALWAANEQEPLAVAFVDMNGLKAINDNLGHDAGDEAIRAFFGVIAEVIAEVGEAYRVGGDEVVILLPKKSLTDGVKLLGLILRGVSNHAVVRENQRFSLSASAGITIATDPRETAKVVRARADEVQYKAKAHSKLTAQRVGALAVDGGATIEEFPS